MNELNMHSDSKRKWAFGIPASVYVNVSMVQNREQKSPFSFFFTKGVDQKLFDIKDFWLYFVVCGLALDGFLCFSGIIKNLQK